MTRVDTVTRFKAEHVLDDEGTQTKTSSTARMKVFPPAEPTAEQRMKLIENSGALDFWDRPEENGYTENDGEPI